MIRVVINDKLGNGKITTQEQSEQFMLHLKKQPMMTPLNDLEQAELGQQLAM